MSYIQIEIGGKLRGLKFNQYAVVTMAQYADLENYEATAAYAMIYAGLKACLYVKREESDFTFEQCCDWVDQLGTDQILKIYEVFAETQVYKNLIEKGKPEVVTKKKLMKKELKT
jgi:hypothetical protein